MTTFSKSLSIFVISIPEIGCLPISKQFGNISCFWSNFQVGSRNGYSAPERVKVT